MPVLNLNMLRNMRWRVLVLATGVAVVLIFEIARYSYNLPNQTKLQLVVI